MLQFTARFIFITSLLTGLTACGGGFQGNPLSAGVGGSNADLTFRHHTYPTPTPAPVASPTATPAPTATPVSSTAPVISNIVFSQVSANSVTISWSTNVPASTQAFYSYVDGSNFQQSIMNTNFSTSHQVVFTNLLPGTSYVAMVRSYDPTWTYVDQVSGLAFATLTSGATPTPTPAPTAAPAPTATPAPAPTSAPAGTDHSAQLPLSTPSTIVPSINGTTIALTDSGSCATNGLNLQTAINQAASLDGNLNHQITLPAGGSGFCVPLAPNGNYGFNLPARTGANANGTGWILIKSNGLNTARGTRTTPSNSSQLTQIILNVTSSGDRAIRTADSARNYWMTGLEVFRTASGSTHVSSLIDFGDGGKNQTGIQPQGFVLDRSYVHGQPDSAYNSSENTTVNHGVSLNSGSAAIVDSWISEIHSTGQDTQAIVGWNGTGPFLVQNNHIEAAGENMIFGGADPLTPMLIPSDITVIQNHMWKNPQWWMKDLGYSSKNLFELKDAQRVLVQGNVFENHWDSSQSVFTHTAAGQTKAINLKSNNQNDSGGLGQYWSTTADVTFRYNVINNACGAMTIAGNVSDNGNPTVGSFRFSIHDNLFENIGSYAGTTSPAYMMSGGLKTSSGASTLQNVYFANNTMVFNGVTGTGGMFWSVGDPVNEPASGLVYQNNIIGQINDYGIKAGGQSSGSSSLFADWGSNAVFQGNLIIGNESGNSYPANNPNVATSSGIWNSDYSLASGSPALTSGVGGTYSGAYMPLLQSYSSAVNP